MKKNIITFAGSNSKNSINKKLATYVVNQIKNIVPKVLDLNDFELPLYGIDYENENGIPENAQVFFNLIKSSDGIVLSLAEHNGSYATVFKNLLDWMSRIDSKLFHNKPMLLTATSPGGRGGATVLGAAKTSFPHLGANIVATYSLPLFNTNFIDNNLINKLLKEELDKVIITFKKNIK